MADTRSFVRKTLTLDIEIKQEWIDYCTKYNDLFMSSCIGYWAYGVSVDAGWLVFDTESGEKKSEAAGIRALRTGAPLPPGYYLLDDKAAIRAWEEGVKLYGVGWYDASNTDAHTYDEIFQKAFFGEIKYG